MSDENSNDLERVAYRTHIASLHALTALAIEKGLFTRQEFRDACKWFNGAFDRLDLVAMHHGESDPNEIGAETKAIFSEIETRLFSDG